MNNKLIWVVVGLLIIVGGGYYFFGAEKQASKDAGVVIEELEVDIKGTEVKKLAGTLLDVTKGATVQGVNTGGESSGVAQAVFENGEYKLRAAFADLPDPEGTDFYEGWVVRRGDNFNFISTGRVEKINDGEYENLFAADIDLSDHDFYVLTIEPDDGDPAPADHILEGTMTP